VQFSTILRAARAYRAAAERFGTDRAPDAFVHLSRDAGEIDALPDFQLTLLPDGRVHAWQVKERRYG
jgi:hypothetical protein